MFKKGFTLAEVLITLGVIGVISALTLPSLMTDTTTAQIGPKLAKAVSAFEQANEAMLNDLGADTLTDAGVLADYGTTLSKYIKATTSNARYITSKDNIKYYFQDFTTAGINTSLPAYQQKLGYIYIDINADTKPNTSGTDRFYFSIWNDGSLRPKGGVNWDGSGDNAVSWKDKCRLAEEGVVEEYEYCAGHIFENNLKVLYR